MMPTLHIQVVWRVKRPEDARCSTWLTGSPSPHGLASLEWAVCSGDPSLVSSFTEPMTYSAAHKVRELITRAYEHGRADTRSAVRRALGL